MDESLLPSATTEAADNVFSMTGSVSGRKEDHQEDDDLTSSEVLIQPTWQVLTSLRLETNEIKPLLLLYGVWL